MIDAQHPVVLDYLDRLRAEAAARLPADRAAELVADIEDHLRERLPAGASEAEVRNAVDRLGSPGELVDEAGGAAVPVAHPAPSPAAGGRSRETVALTFLVLSVVTTLIVPVAAGLLVVGLVLAFTSTRWDSRDKTLVAVVYIGLGMPVLLLGGLAAVTTTSQTTCIQTATSVSSAANRVCTSDGGGPAGWVLGLVVVAFVAIHVLTAVRLHRRGRERTPD